MTWFLTLDLRQPFTDAPGADGLPPEMGGALSVVGIVAALERAAADDDVKGLYLRGGNALSLSPSQAQEVHQAIVDFSASGKFVTAYVHDLVSTSVQQYHIISAADEIWMQPGGAIMSQGFGMSRRYFKNTLEKLDSSAQAQHYHEYKTAFHSLLNEDMTEPEREAYSRLLQSVYDELTSDIARSRDISVSDLKATLQTVPLIGEEAVDGGLVDKLGYDKTAEDAVLDRAGEDAEFVSLRGYISDGGYGYDDGESVIAFIHGSGPIVEGEAEPTFFGGSDVMAGDTIARAIREATEDEDVSAIIFRVDTPGGSPIASDQIWYAIEEAQEAGKPVIINMSSYAASGGYWVSMGADKIVAQPTTVTGSIGIVGGKLILKGAYEKLGVNVRELSVGGEMVHMFSDQHPFSEKEWLALRKLFDDMYSTFIEKVADGREIPLDTVKRIARGRVWTGADAHDRKLVDELGGIKTALKLAKQEAGIAEDADVEFRQFPEPLSFYEQIAIAFGGSAQAARTFAQVAEVLELQPVAELMTELKEIDAARSGGVQARTYQGQLD